MNPDSRSLLRLAGMGIVILALVLGGVLVGARLWPRVVTIERRVVARPPAPPAATGLAGLPDIIDHACPAVVAIDQALPPAPAAPAAKPARRGRKAAPVPPPPPPRLAGFLISADGYVLTGGPRLSATGDLRVLLNDGRVLPATRAMTDPLSGIVLLKVDADGLPTLAFADADLPRVGQWGVALAAPNGSGCIAQLAMVGADFVAEGPGRRSSVRVDPAPDPRFTGAPVLGPDGRVLGIAGLAPAADAGNGSDKSETDAAAAEAARRALLLPAGTAARIASILLRRGEGVLASPFGIAAEDLLPVLARRLGADRQRGAVVSLVAPGSPADKAGLRAGDVILSAGGAPLSGASELARALDTSETQVPLTLLRRGQRLTLALDRD